MKLRFLPFVVALLLPFGSLAQGVDFDGDWSGTVTVKDQGALQMRFVIKDGKYTQYNHNDGEWSQAGTRPMEYYREFSDIAMMGWIQSGGVWTENQSYSLTWVDSDTVQIVWTRHVTNRNPDEKGTSWNIVGEGTLKRQS